MTQSALLPGPNFTNDFRVDGSPTPALAVERSTQPSLINLSIRSGSGETFPEALVEPLAESGTNSQVITLSRPLIDDGQLLRPWPFWANRRCSVPEGKVMGVDYLLK